jgi:hypothetical protein
MRLWWFGALISLVMLLAQPLWRDDLEQSQRTPFDNTGTGHAEQWRFLHEAAPLIPQNSSFTVVAGDRDVEMSLAMMSVGLLAESRLMPSSYYGEKVPAGASARFVLVYGDSRGTRKGETFVASVPGGTLRERLTFRP